MKKSFLLKSHIGFATLRFRLLNLMSISMIRSHSTGILIDSRAQELILRTLNAMSHWESKQAQAARRQDLRKLMDVLDLRNHFEHPSAQAWLLMDEIIQHQSKPTCWHLQNWIWASLARQLSAGEETCDRRYEINTTVFLCNDSEFDSMWDPVYYQAKGHTIWVEWL